jgi:hypothetical protein
MSESEKKPNLLPRKRVELKDFINDNDKLLASIGIMGALAAFFTTIKGGTFIAFLAFALMLVLDVELVRMHFKIVGVSMTMFAFEFLSQLLPSAIGVFLLQAYPLYFTEYFAPLLIVLVSLASRNFFSRRIKNPKTARFAPIVLMIGIMSAYLTAYLFAVYFLHFQLKNTNTFIFLGF